MATRTKATTALKNAASACSSLAILSDLVTKMHSENIHEAYMTKLIVYTGCGAVIVIAIGTALEPLINK